MPARPAGPAALLRGAAAGALTAALAMAAHAAGGGAVGAAAGALLAVLSAVVGAVAVTADRMTDAGPLAVLLGGGQTASHLVLSATGHSHAGAPAAPMLAAHGAALLGGAALIAVADRLCRLLCSALRRAVLLAVSPGPPGAPPTLRRPGQPLHSRLVVAVSISHRGPPAMV